MFLLVPAHPGSREQRAVKRLRMCACVLIQRVYAMGEFPMPGLGDLRDKYTSLGAELANVACLAGMFPPSPPRNSPRLSIYFRVAQ